MKGAVATVLALVMAWSFLGVASDREHAYAARQHPSGCPTGWVALTFDDGPQVPWTEQILDILDEHGAGATFFCRKESHW